MKKKPEAERELDSWLDLALGGEALEPSPEFEAALFERAEDLLSERRDRVAGRELERVRARETSRRRVRRAHGALLRLTELPRALLLDPAMQGVALAVLLAIAFAVNSRGRTETREARELPEFSKSNEGHAEYEAQWRAERQAYQKQLEEEQNANKIDKSI